MKKLFVILAAVCLFTAANVFAYTDTWDYTGNGEFSAGILCTPSWNLTTAGTGLGNFFAGHTDVTITGTHSVTAVLTGPGAADYTFDITPGTNAALQTYGPVNGANLTTATLETAFGSQYKIYDNANTSWITGDWTVALANPQAAFGCEGTGNALTFVYTPTKITTNANATGSLIFHVTAKVTVNI